jgi:uncharacterized protein
MHPVIAANQDTIEALCRRYGVRSLWLFGSAARGDYDASSDFDFLADFGDTDPGPWASNYLDFVRELEVTLGRRIDVVTIGALRHHPRFAAVEADKVTLYAAA